MKKVSKNELRLKRNRRVRAKISGTANRPRLSVFKSLTGISVQVIDDERGVTLVSASLKDLPKAKNVIAGAMEIGKLVAKKCKEAKIETVVFDRSGNKYHGKVKAIAEGAREGGLKL